MLSRAGVTRDQIDSAIQVAAGLELTDDQREAFEWIIADIDRIWSELLNKDIQIGNTKVEVGCVLPASDEHREDQDMKDTHSDPRT
jgi:hypothetical protein